MLSSFFCSEGTYLNLYHSSAAAWRPYAPLNVLLLETADGFVFVEEAHMQDIACENTLAAK